ncbi:hypothetical protein D3C71_1369430 [compost metagenome]
MKKTEKRNPASTPAMAALPVVLFQNMPRINMANTPGLIKPVYFWIKVKPPSPPIPRRSFQVKSTARIIPTNTVVLPTKTRFFSSVPFLKYLAYMSRVKIVEMLFTFPASEATMAAVNAATDKPLRPVGKKVSMAE